MNFRKIVERNRDSFKRQKISLSDQKSIDLTVNNIRLNEIIDYIIWSNVSLKNKK